MTYKAPQSTSTEPGLITLTGDLGGTATSPVVESIQGNSLNLGSLGATQDGYVLTWTNSSSQWQARAPGSTIAQGIDYQFSNSSSDIGGYSKLLDVASGSQGDLSAAVTSGGGKTLIKAFTTPSNLPGISVIPAGLWEFNYYGYASLTGAFTTQLVFDVYTRTTGGTETLLFSVTGPNLNVTSVSRFTVSFNVTTDTYIDDTQRLVIKVSAQTSNIVSVTAHFVFDGTTNTSLVRTPISGDAIQLGGDLSGTTTSATVVNVNGASVPASGSLTTGNVLQVSGSSALTYAAVNLAGGANFVTGNLPISNVAPGTSAQVLMSNGTPATTWTTLSSDVTVSATGVTTINSISGSSPISITPATLQWATGTSSPTLTQASESTVTKGKDLTITPQQSTHTTDQGGGNLIVALQSPTGAGAEAGLQVTRGGSLMAQMGPVISDAGTVAGVYLIPGVTPSSSNWSIASNTSNATYLNAPTGGTVALSLNGGVTVLLNATSSNIQLTPATLEWTAAVTSPSLTQITPTSDVATQNLTIQSQAPFASASTNTAPGNIILNVPNPVGSGAAGAVIFEQGGTFVGSIQFDPTTSLSALYLQNGITPSTTNFTLLGTSSTTILNGPNTLSFQLAHVTELTLTAGLLQWAAGITSPTVNQATAASDVATQALTIQAQAAFASASTNKNGGNLILAGGTAAAGGTVGTITLQSTGVSVGTANVAGTGTMRFSNGVTFNARNAGLSADMQFIQVDSSNQFFFGNTTLGSATYVDSVSSVLLRVGGVTEVNVGSSNVAINLPIQLKTNIFNDATATVTTTTDGTLTTIYTDSAIPASTTYDYVVTVVGINTSNQDTYRSDFSFTYVRVGSAAPTSVGAAATALNVRTSGSANTWGGASIALSTNSVIVQVTGLASTNIDWNCSVNRIKVA